MNQICMQRDEVAKHLEEVIQWLCVRVYFWGLSLSICWRIESHCSSYCSGVNDNNGTGVRPIEGH